MIDPRSFRQLMGCFATGVVVVGARDNDGKPYGLTVNSLTSVSLKPALLLFCIDHEAFLYPLFRKTSHFSVNILSQDQENISRHFSDPHHHARPKGLWDKPQLECPILRHTLGWAVCQSTTTYKAGDHDIVIGRIKKLHKRSGVKDPLLYFRGRYRHIEKNS